MEVQNCLFQFPTLSTVGVPERLAQPFQFWIKDNKLEALLPFFLMLITGLGYGSLDEIPTNYALMFANPTALFALLNNQDIFTAGASLLPWIYLCRE